MADELNTPNHRWYQRQNNVQFAKQDMAKQWIYASGIARLLGGVSPFALYAANDLIPQLIADFSTETYAKDTTETTFSDLITHSRTGNATMVDADGLLKWAPHNLLTYSEDFSNAAWFGNAVAVPNTTETTAPDGTVTATKLSTGTAVSQEWSSNQLVSSTLVLTGVTNVFKVFLKAGTHDYVYLSAQRIAQGENFAAICIDLSLATPAVSSTDVGTAAGTVEFSSVTDVGNGWYECELGFTATFSASANIRVGFASSATPNWANYGAEVFSSAGSEDFYIWGAHTYRSDLGGMVNNPDTGNSYVPTTSAAVYSPRRGNHVYNGSAWVNEGLLLESEARTNFLPYSNDFTNAAWGKTNCTVTTPTHTGPDGAATTHKIVEDSSTTVKLIAPATVTVTPAVNYTMSCIVEDDGVGFVVIGARASASLYAWASFNLTTGAFVSSAVTGTNYAYIGSTSENLGGGFYRVSATFTFGDAVVGPRISLSSDGTMSASGGNSYLGDGTSGIYIYGAQLETGSTPSSYIPTAGASVTRAAETLTVAAANMPWPTPVETTGTELVTNGTFDTDTDWSKAAGASIEGGILVFASGASTQASQPITLDPSKQYLVTIDVVRRGGGVSLRFTGGTTNNFESAIVATGAYTYTVTPNAGNNTLNVVGTNGSNDFDFDNISVKEINPLSVSIQMDGLMTYADDGDPSEVMFSDWGSIFSNGIQNRLSTSSGGTGGLQTLQGAATVIDAVNSVDSYSPDINVPFNIASRHGSTFINGAVDGVALTANTTPTALPDLSATDFDIGSTFMGNIGKLRVWADDIGDTGIAEASA